MSKFFLTLLVCAVIGAGLGFLQASYICSGIEERFLGSRVTLAEARGQVTREEILKQASGYPKVEVVGGPEYDFGMMQHGAEMSHSFVFRNVGDGPLVLEMGESTCKCTVGELETSVLSPGEETEVTLTWKAQAYLEDFAQAATIKTNDTENLEVSLRVSGKIAQSFVMEPNKLVLGTISDTEKVEKTFYVFTYLEDSKTVQDFLWTDPKTRNMVDIQVEKVPVDTEAFPQHKNAFAAHRVNVTIQPGVPLGPLSARVQFHSDQEDRVGSLELPVTGTVVGELELQGGPSFDTRLNLVDLGNIKSSEGASVTIFLFIHGDRREEIIPEIESVHPENALRVTLGEPKRTSARVLYPIVFEVPKGAPEVYYPARGKISTFGRVVLKLKGVQERELPISVRLSVTQ